MICAETERELIKILTEDEILKFIQEDEVSNKKRFARVGERYYEGDHDIKDYKLYYYDADGKLIEDKTRSNIKISHPFFTELVDQEVQYMLSGKNSFMKSDNPELQEILDEYFNDQQTYYYTQINDGKLILDKSEEGKPNPRPHVLYKKENDDSTYYEGFGFIPFFRLDNCRKQFSALKPIKTLIDDYDLMSCGLSNNLQDASEYLVVVKGFQGDNLEELIQNVKTKKHIGVGGDNGGDVDFKTVDIPYEARKIKLELDEKNIYRFGMGFNSAQLGDGNITNIVIKSRYALLDLKCNKLEIRLKQFLRKILKVVLNEVNSENKTDYQPKDVYFDFEREVMTNAQDNAQIEYTNAQRNQIEINTLLSLQSVFGDELTIQQICDVLDLNYEDIKDKLPTNELDDAQAALNGTIVNE